MQQYKQLTKLVIWALKFHQNPYKILQLDLTLDQLNKILLLTVYLSNNQFKNFLSFAFCLATCSLFKTPSNHFINVYLFVATFMCDGYLAEVWIVERLIMLWTELNGIHQPLVSANVFIYWVKM
jgi:hypothetical protein